MSIEPDNIQEWIDYVVSNPDQSRNLREWRRRFDNIQEGIDYVVSNPDQSRNLREWRRRFSVGRSFDPEDDEAFYNIQETDHDKRRSMNSRIDRLHTLPVNDLPDPFIITQTADLNAPIEAIEELESNRDIDRAGIEKTPMITSTAEIPEAFEEPSYRWLLFPVPEQPKSPLPAERITLLEFWCEYWREIWEL